MVYFVGGDSTYMNSCSATPLFFFSLIRLLSFLYITVQVLADIPYIKLIINTMTTYNNLFAASARIGTLQNYVGTVLFLKVSREKFPNEPSWLSSLTFDGHSRNLFGHFDQTSHVNGRGPIAQGTAFFSKEVPLSVVE